MGAQRVITWPLHIAVSAAKSPERFPPVKIMFARNGHERYDSAATQCTIMYAAVQSVCMTFISTVAAQGRNERTTERGAIQTLPRLQKALESFLLLWTRPPG